MAPADPIDSRIPVLQRDYLPAWREQYLQQHLQQHPPPGFWAAWFSAVWGSWTGHAHAQEPACRGAPDEAMADAVSSACLDRRRRNMAASGLYRLPDELLLAILDHADLATQERLRQSCWRVLALVGGHDRARDRVPVRGWRRHVSWARVVGTGTRARPPRWRLPDGRAVQAYQETRVRLLDETRRCRACLEFAASGAHAAAVQSLRAARLWCAGCGVHQQALAFSAAQRRAPDAARVCIGRDGRLTLCAHRTVSFADVMAVVRSRRGGGRGRDIVCRHEEHRHNELDGESSSAGGLSSPAGWSGWWSGWWPGGRADRSSSSSSSSNNSSRDRDSFPRAYVRPPPGPLLCRGRRVAWERLGVAWERLSVAWERLGVAWEQPAFAVDTAVPVTRAHLRSFLDAQRTTTTRTAFSRAGFCPHVTPYDHRLLTPFEPGRCACFDDPARADPGCAAFHEHASALPYKGCCRQRAAAVPVLRGCFLPGGRGGREDDDAAADNDDTHTFVCSVCYGRYTWVRDASNRVSLRFHRPANVCAPTSRPWLSLLQPASWRAAEDAALHRVTWCATPGCQTGALWTHIFKWV